MATRMPNPGNGSNVKPPAGFDDSALEEIVSELT